MAKFHIAEFKSLYKSDADLLSVSVYHTFQVYNCRNNIFLQVQNVFSLKDVDTKRLLNVKFQDKWNFKFEQS